MIASTSGQSVFDIEPIDPARRRSGSRSARHPERGDAVVPDDPAAYITAPWGSKERSPRPLRCGSYEPPTRLAGASGSSSRRGAQPSRRRPQITPRGLAGELSIRRIPSPHRCPGREGGAHPSQGEAETVSEQIRRN